MSGGERPRSESPAHPEVRRVFMLRPDNLGDVVLFTGALRHLRALYPRAEISLCVKRYVAELLEHCPHVDRLLLWEDLHPSGESWTRRVRGLTRVEAALRTLRLRLRGRAEVALLPVRSPSPAMHDAMAAVRATARYGIAGSGSNQPEKADRAADALYTRRLLLRGARASDHELEVQRDFLRLLGAQVETSELRPEFWTTPEDRRWAAEHVRPEPGTVLLALSPGVTAPAGKAYAPARYAQVLARVSDVRFSVVLLGGAPDAAICAQVQQGLAGAPNVASVTNLAGLSTVRQMVESLRRSDVVLGPDSAPLHVAVALGKPTVCILGGGHFGRFHPWGDPRWNRIAHRPMECYGCGWICRYPTMRCIQEIAPETVAAELREALGALPPRTGERTGLFSGEDRLGIASLRPDGARE